MSTSSENANPWFGVSMVLIGVIVGYSLGMSSGGRSGDSLKAEVAKAPTPVPAPQAPPAAPSAKVVKPIDPKVDHVRGNPDATITIMEWSDFQCPFCKRHHPTMIELIKDNDVNWAYFHFPLAFHANAQIAAEATECAWDQGGDDAFWEFTDKIFESGTEPDQLYSYADEMSLDAAEFKDCVESNKFADKVAQHMKDGSAAGVSGTPGNVVYNNKTKESRLVSGAQPASAFEAAIEALLN